MTKSTTPPQSSSPCDDAASRKPPDDSGGATTLGDFSRLFIGGANSCPVLKREPLARAGLRLHGSLDKDPIPETNTRLLGLGNFSKILCPDGTLAPTIKIQPATPPQQTVTKILQKGETLQGPSVHPLTTRGSSSPHLSSSPGPSVSPFDSDSDAYVSPFTPQSTTSRSPRQHPPKQPNTAPAPAPAPAPTLARTPKRDLGISSSGSGNDSESAGSKARKRRGQANAKATPIKTRPIGLQTGNPIVFSFQCPPFRGPLITVQDVIPSQAAKHTSLMSKLISQQVLDAVSSAKNGIHVFLDMSNITIGFQKSLKMKYRVPDPSSVYPIPKFNIPFFNELLVRGREAVRLNAGCSTLPGMKGDAFIPELEALGYRVDLRNRQQDPAPGNRSSTIRYIESMVDETIQGRIAETVMEYFDRQGTLVIATGDAKPANFSDGFFAYAERALKMGWHVEVVSWSTSLSRTWSNPDFVNRWPTQFRIINLDFFLDELFAHHGGEIRTRILPPYGSS